MRSASLADAEDHRVFGGKAVHLGAALRAGLPVPPGVALSTELVDALVRAEATAKAELAAAYARLEPPLAARSSAVDEDSEGASFAGQHTTRLGVYSLDELLDAVVAVQKSALAPAALAYRQRLGIAAAPRMGVVVQRLVDAERAGVLFTCNPLNGRDERVIEAAWGLGETVVAGLVTPDRYRVARDGRVLERSAGDKDLALHPRPGGLLEEALDPARAAELCLDDSHLARLHELALRCEAEFGSKLDLEWAFDGPELYLLQQRPITRTASA